MDDIRDQLLRKAYLYADTDAYRAGVEAALAAMADPRLSEQAEGLRDDQVPALA